MASNPIKRRATQAFLIGLLLGLVVTAVAVVLLVTNMNKLKEEKEKLESKLNMNQKSVYIANTDLKSGDEITIDSLKSVKVSTEADITGFLTPNDFEGVDENGDAVKYYTKLDIESGSVVSAKSIYTESSKVTDDQRIVEYNMIVLPSQLQNGNYIDIRLRMPDGQDYIVLSKKHVEQTTSKAIWINVSELDILTMNSAIVESYWITGSKLYATIYTEPGMQDEVIPTYAVNNSVLTAINEDVNIVEEARKELSERWSNAQSEYGVQREKTENYTNGLSQDEKASSVESGTTTEITDIGTLRDEFVSELEGTGLVGTTN